MNILNKYVGQVVDKVTGKVDESLSDKFDAKSYNTVNEFRQKLSGGLAFSNNFVVGFSLPSFLKGSSFLSYLGVSSFDSELGLYCNKVTNPAKKIKTNNVTVYNNLNRIIPNGYDWSTIQVSFIETADRKIFQLFQEWMDGINNPITNCGNFYADSIGEIKVNMLNRAGETKGYIVYEEAMPISLSFTDLDWNSTSNLVSVSVDFSYIYQTTRDYTIKDIYNSVLDFGDSDIAQLINRGNTAIKNIAKGQLNTTGKKILSKITTRWF